jgi:RND superfamily putative drug exporter
MAVFLYRLGRFTFRHRFMVIFSWITLFILAGIGASSAVPPAPTAITMPGTEAQRALDLLEKRFPETTADGATARIVFKARSGQKMTDRANRARVQHVVQRVRASSPQVGTVTDPFATKALSEDRAVAYSTVSYRVPSAALAPKAKTALLHAADEERSSLTVEFGGSAVQQDEESGTEVIGIAVAAIALLITFGSLVAAGLPLLTAFAGVGTGISIIALLARPLDLGDTTSTLATMLGLAVGIDYALFVVTRYRAELAEGHSREEAAARALGTAGSAVIFAGLTVVIALAGLSVAGIPLLTKMGLAAAGTVILAVLVTLTLLPALLGLAGKYIFGRRARKRHTNRLRTPSKSRWAAYVLRKPITVLLMGVVGLGALTLPAASLELGLPDEGSLPVASTQRRAYDLLSESFGPGFNGPLLLVVDAKGSADAKSAVKAVTLAVKQLDGIAGVTPPALNREGDTATVTVIPTSAPSSHETKELVAEVRKHGEQLYARTGAKTLVTGQTGMAIDFSQKMRDALLPYICLIVGLAFLLLALVFRSILVPLKAALGFLLSVGASLGAVVAVFQWGWLAHVLGVDQTGPVMSTMPIFLVGIVFGLAMDYEVFLVTRMREAYIRGAGPVQAIATGFDHSARVVTAAAIIMIAVFGGFMGSSETMVKMMGFDLATAVLFDAFIVRMTVVPAVLSLLGHRAWWLPRWLDRLLPDIDIEGTRLQQHVSPSPATAAEGRTATKISKRALLGPRPDGKGPGG